jgi:hypothetical protein
LIGLLTGVIAGFAIYIRYHYVYAAIAGMLCMILLPFQTTMSETAQHVAAGALCLGCFAVFFSLKRNQTSFDYPATTTRSSRQSRGSAFTFRSISKSCPLDRCPDLRSQFQWGRSIGSHTSRSG